MTREELNFIKQENEKLDIPDESPVACVFHLNDLAITKIRCRQLIDVLEAAWNERDAALAENTRKTMELAAMKFNLTELTRIKDNLVSQNTELLEDIQAMSQERDTMKHRMRELEEKIEGLASQKKILAEEIGSLEKEYGRG